MADRCTQGRLILITLQMHIEHQPLSLAPCDELVKIEFDMLPSGVQGLEGAVGLKALVVSFNELSSMEGMTSLTRLTRLDLSFNAIPRIQGLKVAHHMALVHVPSKILRITYSVRSLCRVSCRIRQ